MPRPKTIAQRKGEIEKLLETSYPDHTIRIHTYKDRSWTGARHFCAAVSIPARGIFIVRTSPYGYHPALDKLEEVIRAQAT